MYCLVVSRLESTDWPGFGHMPTPGFKGILEREIVKNSQPPDSVGLEEGRVMGNLQFAVVDDFLGLWF